MQTKKEQIREQLDEFLRGNYCDIETFFNDNNLSEIWEDCLNSMNDRVGYYIHPDFLDEYIPEDLRDDTDDRALDELSDRILDGQIESLRGDKGVLEFLV